MSALRIPQISVVHGISVAGHLIFSRLYDHCFDPFPQAEHMSQLCPTRPSLFVNKGISSSQALHWFVQPQVKKSTKKRLEAEICTLEKVELQIIL